MPERHSQLSVNDAARRAESVLAGKGCRTAGTANRRVSWGDTRTPSPVVAELVEDSGQMGDPRQVVRPAFRPGQIREVIDAEKTVEEPAQAVDREDLGLRLLVWVLPEAEWAPARSPTLPAQRPG